MAATSSSNKLPDVVVQAPKILVSRSSPKAILSNSHGAKSAALSTYTGIKTDHEKSVALLGLINSEKKSQYLYNQNRHTRQLNDTSSTDQSNQIASLARAQDHQVQQLEAIIQSKLISIDLVLGFVCRWIF